MRLPTAPASSRARAVRPKGWRNRGFHTARASSTDITREMRARTQVWSENREKAAPVFST